MLNFFFKYLTAGANTCKLNVSNIIDSRRQTRKYNLAERT